MTGRGKRILLINIIVALLLFIFFAYQFGFKNSYDIIGIFSNLIPFILAGIIMLVFGINENKWGKVIYGIVFLLLFYYSIK
jgi:O-antigen ligase